MLIKALHKSITVKKALSVVMELKIVYGLRTVGCHGITMLLIALRSRTDTHACPFGLRTGRTGVLQGLVSTWNNQALGNVCLYYGMNSFMGLYS